MEPQSAGGRRQQRRVMFAEEEVIDLEPLQAAGSQNNLIELADTSVVKPTSIRKTRVNFMNGHHMVCMTVPTRNARALSKAEPKSFPCCNDFKRHPT